MGTCEYCRGPIGGPKRSFKKYCSVRCENKEQGRQKALRDAAGYFHDGPWRCSRASRILEGLARGEERPDGQLPTSPAPEKKP